MPGKALGRWLVDRTIKRRGPGSAALYALARRIVSAYENNDIHMETNGEAWLISELASRGPMVAVDIGANRGEWARYVLAAMNGGQVICYEPAPRTFGLLQAAVTDPRAVLVNAAASSKAGTLTFNINLDNDFVSSVVDLSRLHERSRYEAVPVPAVTGDDEMTRLGVERVGFLKIDAEGHDLEALAGFGNGLAAGRVDVFQFEYNAFTRVAGHALDDYVRLAGDSHLLCRLLPKGLEASGYHLDLDDFRQANWVGVRYGMIDPALVRDLGIRAARGLGGFMLRKQLAGRSELAKVLGLV